MLTVHSHVYHPTQVTDSSHAVGGCTSYNCLMFLRSTAMNAVSGVHSLSFEGIPACFTRVDTRQDSWPGLSPSTTLMLDLHMNRFVRNLHAEQPQAWLARLLHPSFLATSSCFSQTVAHTFAAATVTEAQCSLPPAEATAKGNAHA